MNEKKIAQLMNGYTNLTIEERQEYIRQLTEYIESSEFKRNLLKDAIHTKMNSTGPKDQGLCPACGK
jgi:hypothetical protein